MPVTCLLCVHASQHNTQTYLALFSHTVLTTPLQRAPFSSSPLQRATCTPCHPCPIFSPLLTPQSVVCNTHALKRDEHGTVDPAPPALLLPLARLHCNMCGSRCRQPSHHSAIPVFLFVSSPFAKWRVYAAWQSATCTLAQRAHSHACHTLATVFNPLLHNLPTLAARISSRVHCVVPLV